MSLAKIATIGVGVLIAAILTSFLPADCFWIAMGISVAGVTEGLVLGLLTRDEEK